MPLTPEDIEARTFAVRKRGYDKTQVDRFLGEVANAYRMVVEGGVTAIRPRQESVAASDLPTRRPLLPGPEQPAAEAPAAAPAPALVDPLATAGPAAAPPAPGSVPLARLGTEVTAVLESAQEQADRIRADAEARAARLRHETEQWSQQVTSDAERYAASRRTEADGERQEATRLLEQAKERAAAADWTHQEAERRLADVDEQVQRQLDQAAHDADEIIQQAERAARARVEGILADADRRLDEAAAALGQDERGDRPPRVERRRPPTNPVRGGRRRTDPPLIDLVRDQDPIIDLVEGGPRTGRAGGEAPLYPVADRDPEPVPFVAPTQPKAADPLTTLLRDAVGEATEADGGVGDSGTAPQ